ncbi:MAG TPA: molybdopterin-dependent oxidoreductase [Caulobacteraceae bacterium]
MNLAIASIIAVALIGAPLACAAQDIAVVGLDGHTVTLTPKDFADLPRAKATLGEGATAKSYEGATLTSILRLIDAPAGARLHGKPVKDYVLVTGADGFSGLMSLAETDSELHRGAAIIADRAEGGPLAAKEGAYRLVVDGDRKPFRSVRNVVRVELKAAP